MVNDNSNSSIIPIQVEGKSLDNEFHIMEHTEEQAGKTFEIATYRLLNPNKWHLVAGKLSASFTIWQPNNSEKKDRVNLGDYLKIDIPGPGTSVGNGYDWVRVEALQINEAANCDESVAMLLRASPNPENVKAEIAHFFSEMATSTFIIKRNGKKVAAYYHGRNEKANTCNTSSLDKIRNKVVATGAKIGISNLQWETLIKGFLESETADCVD